MDVKALIEKRRGLVEQSRKYLDENKGAWGTEHQAKFDAMQADIDKIKVEVDGAAQREAGLKAAEERILAEERELGESRGRKTSIVVADPTKASARDMDLAFRGWGLGKRAQPEHLAAAERCGVRVDFPFIDMAIRTTWGPDGAEVRSFFPVPTTGAGDIDVRALAAQQEQRDMSIGTTTAGGNMVPNEMMQRYSDVQKWYGRLAALATPVNTETGATLPWPAVDDTANTGAQKSEGTSASAADPTINVINFGAWVISSKRVPVSWELLQDSFVNINMLLGTLLGRRIARFKNTKFTVGAGTTEPKGLITGAATGKTAASTIAFTADEVIDLIHSVDKAYRNLPDTGFMIHDTVVAYVRKFKDGQGRYLWEPALQAGQPDRFYGYAIETNNDMDSALTTGKKLVGFGNIPTAFVVRSAGATRFIRDESILVQQHQTYFEAYERVDSNVVDSTAFKILVLA